MNQGERKKRMNFKVAAFVAWCGGGLVVMAGLCIAFPHAGAALGLLSWVGYAVGSLTLAYIAIDNH